MAKIFNSNIGFYLLGPMGSPPPDGDKKKWNVVKSMIFSLKDSLYHAYISKFKATSSLSYSTSYNFDVGCDEGDQYCKSNTSSTTNTQWKVATATDYKTSTCQDANPKCNTKEATTLELMYYVPNSWRSKIESKYRVTNAEGNCPEGPEISNCKTKMRNCCQDSKMVYIEAEERWVRVNLTPNPDTTFNDHTYKVDSYISVNISSSGSSGGQFLDDSNYKVQGMGSFGGSYLYLEFESDYNPTTCENFTGKGTLSFVGKIPASFLQGKPCGTKGQAFLSISWSPSSNAALMPS